jgi:two-component system response regulator TctD
MDGSSVPILMLTARDGIGDRVKGLDLGADDYLPKPFDLDELEARVRALARRGSGVADPRAEPADFHGLRVDASSGAVYCRGQPMELAPREAALLRALLSHAGQAVAKERLFDQVFAGEDDVQPDAIEVVAYRLRKKLAATDVKLVTLRGLGYLVAPQ